MIRPRRAPAAPFRYGVAILVVAIALAATYFFAPLVASMRLIFLWSAILVAAAYGGIGPALLALGLSVVGAAVLVFPPVGSIAIADPADVLRLGIFTAFALALGVGVGLRRQAEQRNAELRDWFRTTLTSLAEGVIVTNAEGRVEFLNPVAESLLGRTCTEADGRELRDVLQVAPEESDRSGVPAAVRLTRRDGTSIAVEQAVAPLKDDGGLTVGSVIVLRDISARLDLEKQRRAALDALTVSEQRYRTLVEAAPTAQAVWTARPEGTIEWADAWLSITGQTREQVNRGGGMDVVHPEDAKRTAVLWQRSIATGTPYEDELRVRVASGRYRWFAIKAVPVMQDGNVVEWVGVIADTDARRRHQYEATFINRATEILNSSLDYEAALRALAKLCVPELGDWCSIDMIMKPGEPYRRLAVEHTDPALVGAVMDIDSKYRPLPAHDPVVRVMETGQPLVIEDIDPEFIRAATSTEEHLRFTMSLGLRSLIIVPMVARDRVIGAIELVSGHSGRRYSEEDLHFVEDLAGRAATAVENARLYHEAEQANRAKDEFLATLSHELRTPLTAIVGWASMLNLKTLDPETTRLAVETILRTARAQGELIDDLLDLSRIVAGKLELTLSEVDFATIVEEVMASTRPAADARRITMTFTPAERPMTITGDDRRIRQIVWNLLSNSVKFTEAGGRIDMTLVRVGNAIRFEVTDTGKGIDGAFLPFVWDRFRQADSSSSRQHGGLGLGLSLVRHIAEMHGGVVFATSPGLGKGATFAVELPVSAGAASGAQAEVHDAPPLTGKRILLVDDDDDARAVMAAMLGASGAQVTMARGAIDALAILDKEEVFDVVVTDLAMPGQDGNQLLRAARNRGLAVPMVAVSAVAGADGREHALATGFVDFIRKPVEPGQLAAVVARHAGRGSR